MTRFYSPGEFGSAAVFAGIVGLVVIVATFRYELAIPLARTDMAAFQLVVLPFLILSIVAPLAGVLWLVASRWLDFETGLSATSFASLIAVGIFAAGAYQILSYWLVRRQKFGVVAITRVQQGLAGNGAQIAMGLAGLGTLGLIVGQIIGVSAGVRRLARDFARDYRRARQRLRPRRLAWAAKRYRQFPLFDTWAGLLSVAGAQAPILLFAAIFTSTLAGYYALAFRFLSAPLGLVGKAISAPLLGRLVEAQHQQEVGLLTVRLLRALAMLSLPAFAIVAVLARDVVPLAFGAEWAPAAVVVAWTATWAGWQFIASPLSVLLIALEAQKLNSLLQLGLVVLRVSGLLAGAALGEAEGALVGFSVASTSGYAAYAVVTARAAGVPIHQVIAAIFHPVAIYGLCLTFSFALPIEAPVGRNVIVACALLYWLCACWLAVRKLLVMSPAASQKSGTESGDERSQ
ncbi:oligosaccharide flippase family protein [Altererythrobacter soli]|uniref:Oligosaccharide flippase family protein n=1 Tax=Croceibacterium soli TaxID=1739690 RepID=A0A6I4URM6_9SPHN|nr:oligosaccharide flippase family protein [Croceibacterium soli]MXP40269.1 oligosaccharide flippase family protein [Croceibacterium soli]